MKRILFFVGGFSLVGELSKKLSAILTATVIDVKPLLRCRVLGKKQFTSTFAVRLF